jgi:hypothetical protein
MPCSRRLSEFRRDPISFTYELETFTQLGVVTDLSEVLDPRGKGWQPKTEGKPVVHRQEFPEDNSVVSFRVGESPHRRR